MSDVTTALSWVNDIIFVSLVNTTLQITILIPLIGLIIRVFRIKSAPTRYSLWLFAMLATLTLPILTPFTPQIDLARLHQQRAADYGSGDMARLGMGTGDAGDMSMANVSVEPIVAAEGASTGKMDVSIVNPVSVVYFIWCAGALSMLLKTVVVYSKLRKLRLSSSDVDSQVALDALSRLREKMGIRRAVALKSSSRVYAPISLGVFSPTVILPGGMLDGGSMDELEMILAHELAHIKRLDYLVRLLQKVLKVFLFFHPLFHLMKRNLAREREHICDDWVILMISHRSRYAECLIDMLERVVSNPVNVPVTLAMAERKQDISGRIDMIMDKTRKAATKVSTKALTVMLIIGCLALPFIGGIAFVRFSVASPASDAGRIAFVRNYCVWVMDADGKNEEQYTSGSNDEAPTWSPDGKKIAFSRFREGGLEEIYVMSSDGEDQVNLTNTPGIYESTPSWSSDGKRIAFGRNIWEEKGGQWNIKSGGIYVIDVDGANLEKLVEGPWDAYYPTFSPDGRKIAFRSTRDGEWGDIYVMDADGADMERLTFNNMTIEGISWSPGGTKIAFASYPNRGNCEIYVMDADGKNQVNLTNTPNIYEFRPSWSPDGTKMAFCSNQDGNYEIYVMDADGSSVQRLTNTPADEKWVSYWTASSYAVEPAGKLKTTWGKMKAWLRPQ